MRPAPAVKYRREMVSMADGGQVTLYDVFFFVAAAAGRRDTAQAAAALLRSLPAEQLTARPWEQEGESEEGDGGDDGGDDDDDAPPSRTDEL
jgi:hypothetical protein